MAINNKILIIGLIIAVIFIGFATISSILKWFSWLWLGIPGLVLLLISATILIIKAVGRDKEAEKEKPLPGWEEAHKLMVNNLHKPDIAVIPSYGPGYVEGRFNIGKDGSTKAQYMQVPADNDNFFVHQILDLKDPENKMIAFTDESIFQSKETEMYIDKIINLFAEKPKSTIKIEKPILHPITGQQVGTEIESKELEEIKEEREKQEEIKAGEV